MRDAATLMLVRDGASGVEVLLVRRHIRAQFVGGAHVFPGGVLEPEDEHNASLCEGLTDAEASARLGIERGGLAWWCAAARECFEEAGILMAGDAPDTPIARGRESFGDYLRRQNLRIAADRILYWAHWITPEGQPLRYDTRFFLAVAPAGQTARHDGLELTESAWIAPAAALQKARDREWKIILPTARNLLALSRFKSAAETEAAAKALREVKTVQPLMIHEGGRVRFVIPGENASVDCDHP
jgi:8-oxo-dGTP pyrophosphatase MutT (NUDIX family)